MSKCGLTNKHQPIANPGRGSGRTNNFELWFVTSTSYFQSAAAVGGRNTNATPAQSPVPCPQLDSSMVKYIITIGIVAIAIIVFLIYNNRRNRYSQIDSYENIKRNLKDVPNTRKTPIADIEELDMEVNNGGFNQYFFNSSGQHCFETLRELKRLGKTKKADLLEKAIEFINPNRLPEEALIEKLRNRQVDELDNDSVNAKLDSLDQVFYTTAE